MGAPTRYLNNGAAIDPVRDTINLVGAVISDDTTNGAMKFDMTGIATASLALTTNGNGASLVGIEDAAALIAGTTVETALAEIVKKANAGLVAPWCLPVFLSTAATNQVVGRFTPRYAGKVGDLRATMVRAATTTDKTMAFGVFISAVQVSGAVVTLATTSTSQSLGTSISGTSVSGLASFAAGQEITIKATGSIQHAEGEALLELFLDSA